MKLLVRGHLSMDSEVLPPHFLQPLSVCLTTTLKPKKRDSVAVNAQPIAGESAVRSLSSRSTQSSQLAGCTL
jgi:hypothetical protein